MKGTKRTIISAILFIALTVSAFAQKLHVIGTAPTYSGSDPIVSTLNSAIGGIFDNFLKDINSQIGNINAKPEKLIQAFGDSQVFASNGATQRGYGDYKKFSVTVGPMFGLKLPGDPTEIVKDLENLAQKLNNEHDIALGVSPQAFNVRVGINASEFLLKNLYLGLHLSYMKTSSEDLKLGKDIPPFNFESFSIGATANYQLITSKKILGGLFLWRGVNIGSGVIFSGTTFGLDMPLNDFNETISGNTRLVIKPNLSLDMKIDTITIPIEAVTGIKLLGFLNIPIGIGADIAFGKSDIGIGMNATINTTGLPAGITSTPGSLSLKAGGDMVPTFCNFKIMTGLGLNFGPVIIDIPLTYYFDNGYSVGLTIGAVW